MNALTLTEQLKALYETSNIVDLRPDEFTCAMFMDTVGCKRSRADDLIEQAMLSQQIVCVGERIHKGKRVKAYRFTNK